MKELLIRNPFTIAWIAWLVLFLVIEGLAIWSEAPGGTLSAHVRAWFKGHLWRQIVGWAFFLWLSTHFLLDLNK